LGAGRLFLPELARDPVPGIFLWIRCDFRRDSQNMLARSARDRLVSVLSQWIETME